MRTDAAEETAMKQNFALAHKPADRLGIPFEGTAFFLSAGSGMPFLIFIKNCLYARYHHG